MLYTCRYITQKHKKKTQKAQMTEEKLHPVDVPMERTMKMEQEKPK